METVVNAGWVMSVLSERGFLLPEREVLRDALNGVDEDARQKVHDALSTIARGVDDESKMEVAGSLGRALSTRIRSTLEELGLPYEPRAVLQWALTSPDWQVQLKKATEGNEKAREQVRESLQSVVPRPDESAVLDTGIERDGNRPPVTQMKAPQVATERSDGAKRKNPPDTAEAHPARTHHVYGAKAALAIELDVARAREGTERPFTLRLEGAKATGEAGAKAGAMRYDWERKLVFQLTHRELHQAAAVFIGASPRCEFSAHGDNRDKRCEIVAQQGGVFVKLSQGKHAVAVPIGADDLYDVALLAVRALAQNDPDLAQGVLLDILRLTSKVAGMV